MAPEKSRQSQTLELLVSYRHQPTVHLRNRLVSLNMGLVRQVAYRISRQCPEPYEDLEQCGSLGLISAIERFDTAHGHAFSSFAIPSIRGEILHFLRDHTKTIRIPRRWHQLYQQSQKFRPILAEELSRQPTEQELANKLDLSIQEWSLVKLAVSNRVPLSLDLQTYSKSPAHTSSAIPLAETLIDTRDQRRKRNQEEYIDLLNALEKIEKERNKAIQLVYLKQLTRGEAAQQMGVSPTTISRRITHGLKELRGLL